MKRKFTIEAMNHSIEAIHAMTYSDGVFECVYFTRGFKEPPERSSLEEGMEEGGEQEINGQQF